MLPLGCHWEQERDGQVQPVTGALTREARALQGTLEECAAQVQLARFPQRRSGIRGLLC